MREIRALTGLRGLAALLVVLYHYVNFNGADGPSWLIALIGHCYIAVDLFFVLSGFVMALSYGRLFSEGAWLPSLAVFLGRRLARIYPLYLLVCAILVLVVVVGHSDRLRPADLVFAAPANLLMVQSWFGFPNLEAPLWSISTEWAAYLVFPLLLALARGPRIGALLMFAAAALLLGTLALSPGWQFHHPERHDGPLSLFGSPIGMLGRCFAEFALGLLAFRFRDGRPGRLLARSRASGGLIALAVVALLFWTLGDLPLVACFVLLIVALSTDQGPVSAFLGSRVPYALGVWSYAIYLLHPLLRRLAWKLADLAAARGLPIAVAEWLGIILTLPLLLLAAVAAHHGVERPGRTAVQRLVSREWLSGRRLSHARPLAEQIRP